ncbi:MAG: hypothetical protein EOT04_02305 [Candidatus Chaera renei]|uniref:Uncharacterized protein n=1 Tax=Candidatus Chaera renei TaxID=2506947 RepID=A0A4Q0AIH3_9BACT|nr:MAG: hypothetical protein EOT04_02305 [Candidatus Chaera renei]
MPYAENPLTKSTERLKKPEVISPPKTVEHRHEKAANNNEKQADPLTVEQERHNIEVLFDKNKEIAAGDDQEPNSPNVTNHTVTARQKAASYRKTMSSIGKDMSPSQKVFSRLIHWTPLEKTSEVVGSTIARPNAILAGSFSAFVLTAGVYILAKSLGYTLSGSETMIAFALGWMIGLAYDYLKTLIAGH